MHFTRFQPVYRNINAAVLESLGNSIEKKIKKAKIASPQPFHYSFLCFLLFLLQVY